MNDELVARLWEEVRPNQLRVVHGLRAQLRTVAASTGEPEPGQRVGDDPATDPDLEVDAVAAAWDAVRRAAHRLAGSLGSFGQETAGEVAIALEELVGGVDEPSASVVERARTLAALLDETIDHVDEPCPSR